MHDRPGSIESNQPVFENIPPRRYAAGRIFTVFRPLDAGRDSKNPPTGLHVQNVKRSVELR